MAVRLKIINFIRIRARRLGVSFGLGNSYVRFIIIRIKYISFLFFFIKKIRRKYKDIRNVNDILAIK